MKKIFIALSLLSICGLCMAENIDITSDTDDCINGWISMDVVVNVNGESFKFDPSCKFSFSEKFKTKSGVECEITAGMCSAFSPKNKIEVTCENAFTESIPVKCP